MKRSSPDAREDRLSDRKSPDEHPVQAREISGFVVGRRFSLGGSWHGRTSRERAPGNLCGPLMVFFTSRKSGRTEERVWASHAMGSALSWTEKLTEAESCLKYGLFTSAGFYDSRRKETLSLYVEKPIVGLMCDLSRILWFQGRSGD